MSKAKILQAKNSESSYMRNETAHSTFHLNYQNIQKPAHGNKEASDNEAMVCEERQISGK